MIKLLFSFLISSLFIYPLFSNVKCSLEYPYCCEYHYLQSLEGEKEKKEEYWTCPYCGKTFKRDKGRVVAHPCVPAYPPPKKLEGYD